jgi:phosphate transport system substrate-binding protein
MNKLILIIVFLSGFVCMGCNGQANKSVKDTAKFASFGSNSNSNILIGAGTKEAYPLLSKLFAEYGKTSHVMVNYQSIGTVKGMLQLTNKAVDFSDADSSPGSGQTSGFKATVLHIPVCINANAASNTDAKDGYPAANYNWILIYKEQNYDGRSLQRAQKMLNMLWWCIHDGQKYCKDVNYVPLSPAAIAVAEKTLRTATFDGKPLLQ